MKKLLMYSVILITLISCGNKTKNTEISVNPLESDRVEVLYFHSKKRCGNVRLSGNPGPCHCQYQKHAHKEPHSRLHLFLERRGKSSFFRHIAQIYRHHRQQEQPERLCPFNPHGNSPAILSPKPTGAEEARHCVYSCPC